MATGDKRYTPNFNIDQIDQKLHSILISKNLFNERKKIIFFFRFIKFIK
jgi:hypothetical protein